MTKQRALSYIARTFIVCFAHVFLHARTLNCCQSSYVTLHHWNSSHCCITNWVFSSNVPCGYWTMRERRLQRVKKVHNNVDELKIDPIVIWILNLQIPSNYLFIPHRPAWPSSSLDLDLYFQTLSKERLPERPVQRKQLLVPVLYREVKCIQKWIHFTYYRHFNIVIKNFKTLLYIPRTWNLWDI